MSSPCEDEVLRTLINIPSWVNATDFTPRRSDGRDAPLIRSPRKSRPYALDWAAAGIPHLSLALTRSFHISIGRCA